MNKKHIKDYIAEDGGWKLDSNNAMDAWEELKERIGGEEAGEALAQAMSYNDLADLLVYIFRQYDFDDSPNLENNITDSKKSVKDSVRKVSWLRNILENTLELLNEYSDDSTVNVRPNTYQIGVPFLGTYDGYIDLNEGEIVDDEETEDELVQYIYDNYATADDALADVMYIKENGPQGFSTYEIKELIKKMDDWDPEMKDSKVDDKANLKKVIKEEKEAVKSYQNEIDKSDSDEEVKVLKHIQKEEKEHKKELEQLKEGKEVKLDDDTVTITQIPREVVEKQNAKTQLVTDFIYDLLKEKDVKEFTIENSEYPWIYVDFVKLDDMEYAEKILEPHFGSINSTDDEGFYFITVRSTEFKGE